MEGAQKISVGVTIKWRFQSNFRGDLETEDTAGAVDSAVTPTAAVTPATAIVAAGGRCPLNFDVVVKRVHGSGLS